jgi:dihydroxy-acid dehydratase
MQAVREAGGEPVQLPEPPMPPEWGVALVREWIADTAHLGLVTTGAKAILIPDGPPERIAGFVAAALRAEIPAVLDAPLGGPLGGKPAPFSASLAALGLVPFSAEGAASPAETAVELGRSGKPTAIRLVSSFSLANALRAGLSLGGGPETVIHLSALGREAGVAGCARMLRVLIPETPVVAEPGSGWFAKRGVPGLLSHIVSDLHHAPTVAGRLKTSLPELPELPEVSEVSEADEDSEDEETGPSSDSRLVLIEGRASATETPCRQMPGVEDVRGECRVFWSEKEALSVVENGGLEEGQVLVVGGLGGRGAPGLWRLDRLSEALDEAGLGEVPVFTDGLVPDGNRGVWASPVWPEAAGGGVISRLQDGDSLRLDLVEERIRANVSAQEVDDRAPGARFGRRGGETGYAARYAAGRRGPLEGGGFGSVEG